ncbi:MAG: exosortase U [Isosphaeraceae bacterium]
MLSSCRCWPRRPRRSSSGRNLGRLEPGDRRLSLLFMAAVWGLLACSVLLVTSWLGAVSAMLAILAGAYALGGRRLVWAVLPAWVMLGLAVPPPFHLDTTLVGKLQAVVSRRSGDLLDVLRITHVMEGNVIDLGSRPLLVDQACSGIYSLFTLGAATVFYMLWVKASWPRAALVLASALFWVIAGNILRVVTIAVLAARYNIDATSGMKHTALGLAGFVLMLGMVACTDRLAVFFEAMARLARAAVFGTRRKVSKATWSQLLLGWDAYVGEREDTRKERGKAWRRLIARQNGLPSDDSAEEVEADLALLAGKASVPKAGRAEVSTKPTAWPALNACWVGRPAAAFAFTLLLLPQFRLPGNSWDEILADKGLEARTFGGFQAETLPAQAAGFVRGGFNPTHRDHDLTWGEDSRAWSYIGPAGRASVSLDYPFVGWHELSDCYIGRGWRVVTRDVVVDDAGGGTVVTDLTRDDGRWIRLVFGLFDRNGRALAPPFEKRDVLRAVRSRLSLWGLGGPPPAEMSGPTHQIQVVTESAGPFPTGKAAPDLLGLYRAAVAAVHEKPLLARGAGEKTP